MNRNAIRAREAKNEEIEFEDKYQNQIRSPGKGGQVDMKYTAPSNPFRYNATVEPYIDIANDNPNGVSSARPKPMKHSRVNQYGYEAKINNYSQPK